MILLSWDSREFKCEVEHEFANNEELIEYLNDNHEAIMKDAKEDIVRISGGNKKYTNYAYEMNVIKKGDKNG